jgi:hypothetical protein
MKSVIDVLASAFPISRMPLGRRRSVTATVAIDDEESAEDDVVETVLMRSCEAAGAHAARSSAKDAMVAEDERMDRL